MLFTISSYWANTEPLRVVGDPRGQRQPPGVTNRWRCWDANCLMHRCPATSETVKLRRVELDITHLLLRFSLTCSSIKLENPLALLTTGTRSYMYIYIYIYDLLVTVSLHPGPIWTLNSFVHRLCFVCGFRSKVHVVRLDLSHSWARPRWPRTESPSGDTRSGIDGAVRRRCVQEQDRILYNNYIDSKW